MGSFVSPAPVSDADILAANAGAAVGAVGSYAMLGTTYATVVAEGTIITGGNLRFANTYTLDGLGRGGQSYRAATGSWRLVGFLGSYNFSASFARADLNVSIFLRVA